MPLAIFTMRKELHGFLFLCMHNLHACDHVPTVIGGSAIKKSNSGTRMFPQEWAPGF